MRNVQNDEVEEELRGQADLEGIGGKGRASFTLPEARSFELPAGTLEPKEPPINCAGRELLEETGYLARRLKPLASFFTSPGILSEKMHAFVAYDLQKSNAALEEGEEIELLPTPLEEAIAMIKTGEILDGKTIATLLMFERFHRAV